MEEMKVVRVHEESDETRSIPAEDVDEASELVSRIRQAAGSLESDSLNEGDLGRLSFDIRRLTEIAKKRADRDRALLHLRAQVQHWEEEHHEEISGAKAIGHALTVLKSRIEHETADQSAVTTVLGLAERLLSAESRIEDTRQKQAEALIEADFVTARSLLDVLESLDVERKDSINAIDAFVAEESSGPHSTQAPEPSTTAHPPESQGIVSETDRRESKRRSVGLRRKTAPSARTAKSIDADRSAWDGEVQDDTGIRKRDTSGDLADTATTGNPTEPPEQLEPSKQKHIQPVAVDIANALERKCFGIAYHLALAVPEVELSAAMVKLVACNYVTDKRATIGPELTDLAGELLTDQKPSPNQPWGRDVSVLTACAALAPALEAPGGTVAQLLSGLATQLESMHSLRALARAAAEVSMTGVSIPLSLLRAGDTVDKWRHRESALRSETKSWLASEAESTMRYHAATKVWQRMLEDWQVGNRSSLGHLFTLLDHPAEEINKEAVSRIANLWRDNCDREIDRIDREHRRRSSRVIDGSARKRLRSKVDQALDFANRWILLIKEQPTNDQAFPRQKALELRSVVSDNTEKALEEIKATSISVVRTACDLLRRYEKMFIGREPDEADNSVNVTDLLHGDLLSDPRIDFDITRTVLSQPVNSNHLRDLLHQDTCDFRTAAIDRARRGDFLGAEFALDFAERTQQIEVIDADRSRAKIEEERSRILQELKSKVRGTTDALDSAYAAGAFTLETYESLGDKIPNVDAVERDQMINLFEMLVQVNEEIRSAQLKTRNDLRKLLDNVPRISAADRDRIKAIITDGMYQIAEDYIERIKSGGILPASEATTDRPFEQFFPQFVESYSKLSQEMDLRLNHVRCLLGGDERGSGASEQFIDIKRLSNQSRQDGVELLDLWVKSMHDQTAATDSLGKLFRAIGFDQPRVKKIHRNSFEDHETFQLDSSPIGDRAVARLPDFGSRADGRYQISLVRNRISNESIIRASEAQNPDNTVPCLVLFSGFLDVDSRRALVRDFSFGGYQPTIVLDEGLIVFLATTSHRRLCAFFDCGSVFAFSQPYDPDTAEVPPEMFFGRSDARDKILSMRSDSAHFVYGGRRLGKTALLSSIAREHRADVHKAQTKIVRLINLKGSGIGENKVTDGLWREFARILSEHDVLSPQTIRHVAIEKRVREWLRSNRDRRILLLVDEADAFLDAERKPDQGYRVVAQIKQLMDVTQRRFKVVFAGLHNVQRAAQDPNTPFAHLGEAIRIGPMLPEDDDDELQNLIRGPLESLGFRFRSNDLVIRIAAETNYYPALAQQFCKELLTTLREELDASGEIGPPYWIEAEMVDRVFNARETRDRIRKLFSWTIQLDPRYAFLTYLIAQKSLDNGNAQPQAISIAEIRDSALQEARDGVFADSFWMFEVLLDEMVGLGILRVGEDRHYAIRTRNLRMLLGNDDEIERRFIDAKNKPAVGVYDSAQFRNSLDDDSPASLTVLQEDRLFGDGSGVGLVFGTHLSGLDRVVDSLREAASQRSGRSYVEVEEVVSDSLRRSLEDLSKGRKAGTYVVVTDLRGMWDPEIIVKTLEFVGRHRSKQRFIRPVFLCGPEEGWKWLDKSFPTHENVERRDVWLGPCSIEFSHRWLAEREAEAHSSIQNVDQAVDPPWPVVVQAAVQQKELASIDEAEAAVLSGDGGDRCVSDILISEDAKNVFRLLSEFSEVTGDELSHLSHDGGKSMALGEVDMLLDWADRLGIVRRKGVGYRLDSTYARGLRGVFEQ